MVMKVMLQQLTLGEGNEVGERGAVQTHHDALELVFMLRLEYEEEEADDVEHDERLVDHAGCESCRRSWCAGSGLIR